MTDDLCWICGGHGIAYVDVLDLGWCSDCYQSDFLDPEPHVTRGEN